MFFQWAFTENANACQSLCCMIEIGHIQNAVLPLLKRLGLKSSSPTAIWFQVEGLGVHLHNSSVSGPIPSLSFARGVGVTSLIGELLRRTWESTGWLLLSVLGHSSDDCHHLPWPHWGEQMTFCSIYSVRVRVQKLCPHVSHAFIIQF